MPCICREAFRHRIIIENETIEHEREVDIRD